MKTCTLWVSLLLAVALLLPAGFAFSQGRMAEVEDAKRMVDENPTFNNRLRLGTLQYLQGVDYLSAGDLANAIESMQAGVWTLEDGKGQIPESHPVFEVSRYGLGYALLKNDHPYEALLVLDQLVAASPDFGKARYLLGVTLVNIPGTKSLQRAVDTMIALAQDGREPYKQMAAHAATRFAYNVSTLSHAQGDSAAAGKVLGSVTDTIGRDQGANDEENQKVRFGAGLYLLESGDTFGALENFEAVHAANPGFRLGNGVALSGVLSNTSYAAGLEQLALGGGSANVLAGQLFQSAADVGDPGALDAHHGVAVAYTRAGDAENADKAAMAIYSKDRAYFDRIKKK